MNEGRIFRNLFFRRPVQAVFLLWHSHSGSRHADPDDVSQFSFLPLFLHRPGRFDGQKVQILPIVRLLQAVDDWPSCQRHLPDILLHERIRAPKPGLYAQLQDNLMFSCQVFQIIISVFISSGTFSSKPCRIRPVQHSLKGPGPGGNAQSQGHGL